MNKQMKQMKQMMEQPDIRVQDEGSIFILYPETVAAIDWIDKNLGEDHQTWGPKGVVVEARYALNVLQGMVRGGLIVS